MLDIEVQKLIQDGKFRCWLDIDINDTRAAYQRAVDFVGAKNLAYSLTSNWLPELGGSEAKRVKEVLYPNDYDWAQKGRCAVRLPPSRIYVELWPEVAPLAVENFVALILGNRGKGQESGCALSYRGCHFHRIVKGFVAQGGDFVKNNGSGGECVFSGKKAGFKDDPAGLKVKLDARGMLAMGNSGKNTNTSQFFFTLADQSKLTGKHVGFGRIVGGEEVLAIIEQCAAAEGDDSGKPTHPVVIADCGVCGLREPGVTEWVVRPGS
jgi:cyclophilin family peptidyl-prolyl cis-trans isomerase